MDNCPQCSSQRIWKDGLRKTVSGDVQRYVCRECGYRFSAGKTLYNPSGYGSTCQICVSPRRSKNLTTVEPLREGLAGATKILEHLWTLRKQGYKSSTIKLRSRLLNILLKRGANLNEPESVKETIAKIEASQGYKFQLVAAYDCFLSTQGLKWNPPNYRQTQKLPFIPQESEIDTLIAAMGMKGATFLQILKETGMRKGEASELFWKDIDTERNTLTVNNPEKNSNSRTVKISNKLVAMLKRLPIKSERVFTNPTYIEREFYLKRKCQASKLQNPRLLNISFHTFRHWKATMEYHKTKDILHVRQLLGHRDINNTLIYTQLVNFESDDYYVKTAKTLEEACELAETGFEYFTTIENAQVFRKRK